MEMNDYATICAETRIYPAEKTTIYPILALCGEAGELANEYKKIMRAGRSQPTGVELHRMLLELGDILWYLNAVAVDLGSSLSDVAEMNIQKLEARYAKPINEK
jgi:NTP pyrophosphatase (non-canonical NTP hydrolase)